jgi:DNA-binding NtrC family response regulator
MSDEMKTRLLVVDDEQSIRRLCMTIGNTLGYICAEAESAEAALAKLESDAPDLLLTDLKLPSLSGVDLLKQTKALMPHAEVAIMTGHGSIESAVDAMKLGAYDYIEKPFRVEKMRLLLQRMAEKVRLVTENEFLRERVTTEENLDGIIGSSANIQDVLRMIARLKDTRTPVLISGESGTGKELAARAIHFRGAMAKTPFVAVDCGSLVPPLWKANSSDTRRARLPGPRNRRPVSSRRRMEGRFSWTRSGSCPRKCRRSCCGYCRKRKCARWAATRR